MQRCRSSSGLYCLITSKINYRLQKCQIKIVTLATRSPYHRDVLRVTRIPRGNCEISVFEDRTVLFLLCNAKTEARMDEFNIDNECEFLVRVSCDYN